MAGGGSIVNQTTPSAALDVLHHQHSEGEVRLTRLGKGEVVAVYNCGV